jgi:hypothetical protein
MSAIRTTEHVFRQQPPAWVWPLLVVSLASAVLAGYLLSWAAALPGIGVLALAGLALGRTTVRLERDERWTAWLSAGGRRGASVELSRLVDVEFAGSGYMLRDETGTTIGAPLDERLRAEVQAAAERRGLRLDLQTREALREGRSGEVATRSLLSAAGLAVALPLVWVGVAVFAGGGVEHERSNAVDEDQVRAAATAPGAVLNPFQAEAARELYLVPLDAKSQRRLPDLEHKLESRFGVRATIIRPFRVDVGLLNHNRRQLDGWMITDRLFSAHEAVHPKRPAVIVAITALDTFNPNRPDDGFAFLTSGASGRNELCGGTISTARFDVWPGSEQRRLELMAARLLGRCLGIEQDILVRSVADVDQLDERAGADPQTIAPLVAWRRALRHAPTR